MLKMLFLYQSALLILYYILNGLFLLFQFSGKSRFSPNISYNIDDRRGFEVDL